MGQLAWGGQVHRETFKVISVRLCHFSCAYEGGFFPDELLAPEQGQKPNGSFQEATDPAKLFATRQSRI